MTRKNTDLRDTIVITQVYKQKKSRQRCIIININIIIIIMQLSPHKYDFQSAHFLLEMYKEEQKNLSETIFSKMKYNVLTRLRLRTRMQLARHTVQAPKGVGQNMEIILQMSLLMFSEHAYSKILKLVHSVSRKNYYGYAMYKRVHSLSLIHISEPTRPY